MKRFIILSIALAALGCDETSKPTDHQATDKSAANAPADNTKKNERDKDSAALTPGDQGESESDRTITQKIRQGVMKDDTLSITAKNVKIITVNSVVTLRGPVKSDQEKAAIAAVAQGVAGVTKVDNQLEIAAK